MKIKEIAGATPLDDETLQGLIPGLTLQVELDEYEAQNIARALLWAQTSHSIKRDLLSITGLKKLHGKMFEDTWKWAGQFRTRGTNIGVYPQVIQNDLAILLGDVKFWIHNHTYSVEEIAIRFHHRLVYIHPFPNGNGRFSRIATDLFLVQMKHSKFSWGRGDLAQINAVREEYIRSLKIADREDKFDQLLKFAKS